MGREPDGTHDDVAATAANPQPGDPPPADQQAGPAAPPLPLDQPWYRELLVVALLVGGALGVLGIAYLGLTGAVAELIFGDPRLEAWSGDWWWIPFTAAGGLLITALRGWWRLRTTSPAAWR